VATASRTCDDVHRRVLARSAPFDGVAPEVWLQALATS